MADSTAKEIKTPKRGRWLRRIGIVLGVLLVLIVALYFVATSGAFVKGVILPKVGKAMNAEVTVADASISPFSHVVFHDFKVKPNGAENLLTAKTVEAHYNLRSIIGGKISVDQVLLDSPTITVVENADGSSNLDPLTQKKPEEPKKPSKPSEEKPSAPPNIDIKSIAVKNATIRQTKNLKGGGQEIIEISNANLNVNDIRNDFTGKMDLSAGVAMRNTGTTNAGNLEGTAGGNYTFSFTKDFKPASINGKATFTVNKADRKFKELAALGTSLDCDATPTQVKQIALRFSQSGQALGEIMVSGPFDAQKTEGKLIATISSIDRRVLNLVGAASGIDFGTTTINSTNEIELAKAGKQIGVTGRLNIARFQVKQKNQTTPTLDLQFNYGVAVDQTAQTAVLKSFDLTGTQDSRSLLDGKLTQPMTISMAGAAPSAGDAALNLSVNDLKLADWRAMAPDLEPAGTVNAKVKVLAQNGGQQLAVDIESKIAGVSAKLGESPVKDLSAQLQAHLTSQQNQVFAGKLGLTDLTGSYGTYHFANYGATTDFDVTKKDSLIEIRKITGELREGANSGGKFDVAGNFDSAKSTGKFDVKLVGFNQNGLRPFLESALGDKKLVSVALDSTTTATMGSGGDMSVKTDSKLANLVVKDPAGSLPSTPLEARVQVDTSLAKQIADIRQCQLTLTPTERAKNDLNLTGSVDLSKSNAITGNLKLVADSLDLTRYYDLFASTNKPTATTTAKTPPTETSPPAKPGPEKEPDAINTPLRNFVCDASIGKLYLREVEIDSFKTTAKVDGGHVLLKPLQLNLNSAPVKTDLDLDLGVPGYRYDVAFSAQGVPIAPFVNTFQPERKGQLAGLLTANGQIKGAGITGAGLQKNLTGDFNVLTTNINMSVDNIRNPLITSVLNVVVQIPGLIKNPETTVANWVGRMKGTPAQDDGWKDEISGAPINVMRLTGTAGNGVIKFQQSELRSSAFSAGSAGEIALASVLDNSKIKMPVNVSLSRKLANKIGFSITDTNLAYVEMPAFLRMEGTIGKPERKIDYTVLAGIAAKAVKGPAGNFLQSITGQKTPTGTNQNSSSATNQPTSTTTEVIKGIGSSLFGGKKQKGTNPPAPPK